MYFLIYLKCFSFNLFIYLAHFLSKPVQISLSSLVCSDISIHSFFLSLFLHLSVFLYFTLFISISHSIFSSHSQLHSPPLSTSFFSSPSLPRSVHLLLCFILSISLFFFFLSLSASLYLYFCYPVHIYLCSYISPSLLISLFSLFISLYFSFILSILLFKNLSLSLYYIYLDPGKGPAPFSQAPDHFNAF